MELKKITEADLVGRGVVGMADTPNLSARRMQEKVEEVVRSVVIPVINENAEKTATKQDLADAVFNSGAGDMQADFYDKDADGIVNRADNGMFVYTQSGSVLSGSGANGKFKAAAGGTYTAFTIDGQSYSVRSGGENEAELTAGVWYTFVLDSRDKTINFKSGGAGLNFKIVGGTTRPQNPQENTIWINTDTAIGEYQFSSTKPATRADGSGLQSGDVWIKTANQGAVTFNALKKNALLVMLNNVYQWNGSDWQKKDAKVYQNEDWHLLIIYFYDNGDQCTEITGGYKITKNDSSQAAIGDGYIQVGATAANNGLWPASYISTVNKVDITDVSTLRFVGKVASYANGGGGEHYSVGYLGVSNVNNNDGSFVAKVNVEQTGDFDVTVDTSECAGEHYIVVGAMAHGQTPNYITMQVTQITGN